MGTEGSEATRGGAGLHDEDAFLVEQGLGLSFGHTLSYARSRSASAVS